MKIELITYRDEFAADFARLNYEWIERYFSVEDEDVKALSDPVANIIDPGGEIFFILVDGKPVGTVAMTPHEPGVFELAKMAVQADFQGQRLSHRLMQACIDFAVERSARQIMLVTNDSLAPALGLYEAVGFEPVAEYRDARYARGNLEMRLHLEQPRLDCSKGVQSCRE